MGNLRPRLGDKLNSKYKRLKEWIAIPTSTVWISPEIRHAPWLKNGILLSRLSSSAKPLMVTASDFSPLPSPRKPVKATCYAKNSHQRLIRKKMVEIMQATVQRSTLKELVKIFVKEEIGKQIQTECSKIYPLQDNCMVRKVRILKQPKFDLTKLMELYRNQPEAAVAATAEGATKNALPHESIAAFKF